jgi:glucokinase
MIKKPTLAIDVGGTNIKIALIANSGKIKVKKVFPTGKTQGKDLINTLVSYVENLLKELKLKKSNLSGIGIGLPGTINTVRGLVHSLTNIPGFKNVPLKKILEKKLGCPIFLDNDANLMALGEYYFGAGQRAENVVCLTLGTGVGGGLIINGKLYRGNYFAAGEIGHIPLDENGGRCNCGGWGCLETYIGNRYLIRKAIHRINKTAKTSLSKVNLTPEKITQAAKKKDKLAIQIWKETGRHLGVALAGVANLLSPDKIIIGGGLAQAGHFLFKPLRQTIRLRAMALPAKKVKVVKAQLGEDAGLIGAAVLVWLNEDAIYGTK